MGNSLPDRLNDRLRAGQRARNVDISDISYLLQKEVIRLFLGISGMLAE